MADGALQAGGDLSTSGGGGGGHFSLGDEIAAVVVILIAFVVAAALFWWVLLPLLLLLLDAVIVLILLAASIVARVLFRRPWTIEATAPGHDRLTTHVVGWRAALSRRDEIADALRHGLRPEAAPARSGTPRSAVALGRGSVGQDSPALGALQAHTPALVSARSARRRAVSSAAPARSD